MKKVMGGAITIILGLICFSPFFSSFLTLLRGTIPLILIITGLLMLYIKYESRESEAASPLTPPETMPADNEPEKTAQVEAKPPETQRIEPKPAERGSTTAEPVDTKPEDTKPEDTKPEDTKPEDTEPVKTQPVENPSDKSFDGTPKLSGNTGSRVFHTPDCRYSKSKHCTMGFSTREEALQEGYKPCGTCNP